MSALLSEADLNDFISPGLACVKPTESKKISVDADEREIQVGKEPDELEKVSITLQDCLACAGCITSSEEILLSRQSYSVFMDSWQTLAGEMVLAVSISPQGRLSLANYFQMGLDQLDLCLLNFFKSYFGCKYFVGTQMGRNITISRTNQVLQERKTSGESAAKPMLSAVCPGFVLYAEKTKPELVPYLLNIKSPQQITGSLLKDSVPQDEKVYHLAIMPCFDKKLEASRPDGEQEVDCVITPKELVTMLQELNVDFAAFQTADTNIVNELSPPGWDPLLHWSSNEGSSSGGFAYQYVSELQKTHPGSRLLVLPGKNSDVREYRLVEATAGHQPSTIASSSELYGFRNIQNMVRRLTSARRAKPRTVRALRKRTTTPEHQQQPPEHRLPEADPYNCDFIEVMACPGGCINGGGLLNSDIHGEAAPNRKRDAIDKMNKLYASQLTTIDAATVGKRLDELSRSSARQYVYEFNPIVPAPDDNIVSVANTW
ncbi:hypothetical protein HG535_0D00270 [Zygotorulaspora mrakii]|uniref:Cytosolic Fe-S cluster assembly factor NAR1 n=1 Tax=Zygotorulaspora mrakii TaxID=42260 RepID=A0A7H9B119_ZYGMR|nr:uncharacterized protein HG535_0D00270 [Zygotorulaspora mrakii]QLG72320.1 hypothetical protein HG535_0D00270 [Zygotorulaspora mrakii]